MNSAWISTEPRWITRERCLVLHEMLLLRYGGACGVRDSAVLDAVLARPKERFASGEATLDQLAACYGVGLALHRPFFSGNLAAALIVTSTFLACNGLIFSGTEITVVDSILGLARGEESEAGFALYLRCNSDPAKDLGAEIWTHALTPQKRLAEQKRSFNR